MYSVGPPDQFESLVEDPLDRMLDWFVKHVRQRGNGSKTKL